MVLHLIVFLIRTEIFRKFRAGFEQIILNIGVTVWPLPEIF